MAQNELTQNIGDAQKSLKILSEDSAKALQETEKMVNALSASFQAVQTLSKAAGKDVTELSKSQQLVNTALSAFQVMVSAATMQVQLVTVAQQLWNMALNANPIGIVITAVSSLIGVISLMSSQQSTQQEQLMAVTEKIREQGQAWNDLKASQAEKLAYNLEEVEYTKELWQELQNLAEANGTVAESNRSRASVIMNELNEATGLELQWIGDRIKGLQEEEQVIDDLLAKKKAMAIIESQEDMFVDTRIKLDEAREQEPQLLYDLVMAKKAQDDYRTNPQNYSTTSWGYGMQLEEAVKQAEENYEIWQASYESRLSFLEEYNNNLIAMEEGRYQDVQAIQLKEVASYQNASKKTLETLGEELVQAEVYYQLLKERYKNGEAGVTDESLQGARDRVEEKKKEYVELGGYLPEGIAEGAREKGYLLTRALQDLVDDSIAAAKQRAEIHSPSKLTAREIGVPLIQGILVGMEQEAPHLFQATVAISKEALERAKAEAGSYREVGSLYLTYLKEGVEANTAQAITTFTNLLNESVEALAAKNPDAKSALQQEGREAINAYTKAIQAGGQESIAAVKELMDEVSQTAQNKYDEISRKQQNLSSKLAGYGSLFQVKDQEVAITDVQQYTATISQYMDLLQQLKARGAGEAVLAEVSRLGIDEGLLVAQELLAMQEENPADFAALVADWEENRRKTEELAGNFYAAEMQQLEESFQEDLNHVLAKVPSLVEGSGRAAMEGFIKGWQSKDEDLTRVIEQTIDRAIRAMQEGWEEHSPSKVTERIGANVGLGFIRGYDTTMSALGRRMAQTVAQESSTFQQQAQAIAANQGGLWARNTTTREIHNNTVQEKVVGLRFSGDLAAVARLLKPELDAESSRYGKRLAQG